MKTLVSCALLIAMLLSTGCAYLQTIRDSKQFKEFCSWSPVAITGIEHAIVESANDPGKAKVTTAMTEAVGYLRLAASQCPAAPTP